MRTNRGESRVEGLWVALATPFVRARGEASPVDSMALRSLVEHCVSGGVDGLVALGTTGEAATLLEDERDLVVETCLEASDGLPLMVGTGSNSTRQAVEWTRRAKEMGATSALVVTPYYNKPNEAGLLGHYEAVCAAAPAIDVVLYNVPGRTGLNLGAELLERLFEIPNLVAVKESSGDIAQMDRMIRTCPAGCSVLAGDDALALPSVALGARGVISVIGNVLPTQTKRLVDAALAGDYSLARQLHSRLVDLMSAMFVETNPVPLKAALETVGLASSVVRPPLAEASHITRRQVEAALNVLREEAA